MCKIVKHTRVTNNVNGGLALYIYILSLSTGGAALHAEALELRHV